MSVLIHTQEEALLMRSNIKVALLIALTLLSAACGKGKTVSPIIDEKPVDETVNSKPGVGEGIRIAWDFSTLRKVSASGPGYCGYARLTQLHDQSLIAVYEADGSVVCVKSTDLGSTWSAPIMIAPKTDGVAMTVPDIVELKDHSILVCYNPRPGSSANNKKFGIKTIKSYDGGLHWSDERLLYEADFLFQNGCWEPSAVQLPSGEIQLFFANEGDYMHSDEQNISMVRSGDSGLTWSAIREIVSFRPGNRDGMPSPIVLQNKNEVAFAIEDNGSGNFKPYIIRSSIPNNWATPVGASSADRNSALAEPIANNLYAGAPYLRQLKTGETILSYQGTEGRTNHIDFSEMKVVIGDNAAKNFTQKTSPFVIAANKSGLWNSLAVVGDNTVVALTSTNTYSGGNTEIWMIKGHIIPEIVVPKETITVDGSKSENAWKAAFPIFIGHQSATQMRSAMAYDDEFLYVYNQVNDTNISATGGAIDSGDGVNLFFDTQNKSYELPGKGVFKLFVSAQNEVLLREGSAKKWNAKTELQGLKQTVLKNASGYVQEIAIPWVLIGGKPATGNAMRYSMSLVENGGSAALNYVEALAGNTDDKPYTWSVLNLK